MNDSMPFFTWLIVGGFGAGLANLLVRHKHLRRYIFIGIVGGVVAGFLAAVAYKQVNEWSLIYAFLGSVLIPEVVEWWLEADSQSRDKTS